MVPALRDMVEVHVAHDGVVTDTAEQAECKVAGRPLVLLPTDVSLVTTRNRSIKAGVPKLARPSVLMRLLERTLPSRRLKSLDSMPMPVSKSMIKWPPPHWTTMRHQPLRRSPRTIASRTPTTSRRRRPRRTQSLASKKHEVPTKVQKTTRNGPAHKR